MGAIGQRRRGCLGVPFMACTLASVHGPQVLAMPSQMISHSRRFFTSEISTDRIQMPKVGKYRMKPLMRSDPLISIRLAGCSHSLTSMPQVLTDRRKCKNRSRAANQVIPCVSCLITGIQEITYYDRSVACRLGAKCNIRDIHWLQGVVQKIAAFSLSHDKYRLGALGRNAAFSKVRKGADAVADRELLVCRIEGNVGILKKTQETPSAALQFAQRSVDFSKGFRWFFRNECDDQSD